MRPLSFECCCTAFLGLGLSSSAGQPADSPSNEESTNAPTLKELQQEYVETTAAILKTTIAQFQVGEVKVSEVCRIQQAYLDARFDLVGEDKPARIAILKEALTTAIEIEKGTAMRRRVGFGSIEEHLQAKAHILKLKIALERLK